MINTDVNYNLKKKEKKRKRKAQERKTQAAERARSHHENYFIDALKAHISTRATIILLFRAT